MPTKLTVEEIEKRFSEYGWELLEKEAKGVMVSYLAKCPCGNVTRKCPRELPKKSGCIVCRNRAIAKKHSIGIKECRRVFESNGFTLLETSYKNANTPMLAICSCGEQTRMTLKSVRSGCKCVQCGYKNRKVLYGKDNPAYNPNLSDEERNTDRRMPAFKEWALTVKKRDGFKCLVCDSNKELVSHHILPFREYAKSRTSINNGVTMCTDCHKEFHGFYGYKDFDHIDFFCYLSRKWGDCY